jgi:hypothetical protein
LLTKLAALEHSEAELSQNLQTALKQDEKEPFAMAPGEDLMVDDAPVTPPDSPSSSALDLSDSDQDTPTISNPSPGQYSLMGNAPSLPSLGHRQMDSNDFDDFVLSVTAAAGERSEGTIQDAEPGMLACTDILPAFFGDDELSCTPSTIHAPTAHHMVQAQEAVDHMGLHHGINWRTGFSGHMGASSAHTDRRRVLSSSYTGYNPRLMSQTNGISRTRKIRSNSQGNGSPYALSNPTW